MKRCVTCIAIVLIVSLPALWGQNGDMTASIAIFQPVNTEKDDRLNELASTIAATVSLNLKFIGTQRVIEGEGTPPDGLNALKEYAATEGIDSVVFGRIFTDDAGRIIIEMSVYSRGKEEIVRTEQVIADSYLAIFDASDQMVSALIGAFSERRIAYGTLVFENSGAEGGYSVFVGDNEVGRNIKTIPQILTGNYTITLRQERIFASVILAEKEIEIEEGVETKLQFSIPFLTEDEYETFSQLDRRIWKLWDRDKADDIKEVFGQALELTAVEEISTGITLLHEKYKRLQKTYLKQAAMEAPMEKPFPTMDPIAEKGTLLSDLFDASVVEAVEGAANLSSAGTLQQIHDYPRGAIVYGPGSAADFGLLIDNSTGIADTTGEFVFSQRNKAAFWFDADFGENLSLASQLSYTFDLTDYFFLTLDQLQLGGEFAVIGRTPAVITFGIGRFTFSDFSRKVFSHTADGVAFKVGLPSVSLSVSSAFTRFLQASESTIIMSKSDLKDRSGDALQIAGPFELGPFGPWRLIGIANIQFSELFLRQTIDISYVMQRDFHPADTMVTRGGAVHTFYFGGGVSGPIVSPLFFNSFFYFNMGTVGETPIRSFLAGGGLDLYLQSFLYSKVGLDFVWASGDKDHDSFYEGNTEGNSTAFIPISMATAGLVFAPQLTNVFYGTASFSIKPFSMIDTLIAQNFSVQLKGIPFFRSTAGPLSVTGIDSESTSLYLGTEADAVIRARLLSDVGVGISVGLFFPGTAMESKEVQILGRFELSLSI